MRALLTGLLFFVLASATAEAQVYNHNGSVTKMDVDGKQVQITYLYARAGIPAKLGTKLFEGGVNERSGKIEGNAYAFRTGCNPVPYWVKGDFIGGDERLILSGTAPRIHPQLCTVIGWQPDSVLVFNIDREPY